MLSLKQFVSPITKMRCPCQKAHKTSKRKTLSSNCYRNPLLKILESFFSLTVYLMWTPTSAMMNDRQKLSKSMLRNYMTLLMMSDDSGRLTKSMMDSMTNKPRTHSKMQKTIFLLQIFLSGGLKDNP